MFRLRRNCSVSPNEKGSKRIFRVTLLCRPPLWLMMFLIIQAAADPQITTTRFFCLDAHIFQKYSNASRNPDLGVCNYGNSSMNTTFFCFLIFGSISAMSCSNACIQLVGEAKGIPVALVIA